MKAPSLSQNKARTAFRGKRNAFTLIEVVLSLGIFSFALLSLVGLMATGLSTVKNSSTNQAITNINRELRASLQAASYSSFTVGTPITSYFTDGGFQTTSSSTGANAPFYKVVMNPTVPTYPTGYTSANALTITVAISYPCPAYTQAATNSYFVAQ